VDLTRRLRLLGVRAGALAKLADLVAPGAASDVATPRAPMAREPPASYSLPLFDT
jgi:DNA polymerase-4